jgi:hypothetical protein
MLEERPPKLGRDGEQQAVVVGCPPDARFVAGGFSGLEDGLGRTVRAFHGSFHPAFRQL